MASFFCHLCSCPQFGHLIALSSAGKFSKMDFSIAKPVETSLPVVGHLMKIWFSIGCSFERAALIGWELGSTFDDPNSEPAPHLEPLVRAPLPIIWNGCESAFLAVFALKAKPSSLVACGHRKAPAKRVEPTSAFAPF